MAAYNGQQKFLLSAAEKYSRLGYRVGFCLGKTYLGEYEPPTMTLFGPAGGHTPSDNFDGISIIPDGIVCVDIDVPDFGVVWDGALPPTWKERSPRGWHLFYRLPIAEMVHGRTFTPKIRWREHVDLLVKEKSKKKRSSRYSDDSGGNATWGEHVLCSPTQGYKMIWPDETPRKDQLVQAPIWLLDALERP